MESKKMQEECENLKENGLFLSVEVFLLSRYFSSYFPFTLIQIYIVSAYDRIIIDYIYFLNCLLSGWFIRDVEKLQT